MIVGTVVLAPPLHAPEPYDRAAAAAVLTAADLAVIAPQLPPLDPDGDARTRSAHFVAQLALALTAARVRAPVLPVLAGAAGRLAPAVGLSQRAARRAVAGYALVDADCPAPGGQAPDWPDAPVAYLASPAAPAAGLTQARLRDWRLTELPDRSPELLAAALLALLR